MSAFKEAIAKDVKGVFINLDEFADKHFINGDSIPCIVDTDITKEKGSAYGGIAYEGVFINAITIYVAEADIQRPVEGELLDLDGVNHTVRNVSSEAGVLVILAEVNAQ